MFKNIIFDWSGVVKDAAKNLEWIVKKMFEELGEKEISIKEIKQNWEQPYMKFWNKYYPDLSLEKQKKLYHKIISRKDCPRENAVVGMPELIKNLKKRGINMSIVSSDNTKNLLAEIKEYGLENIFDEIITDVHDKSEGVGELIKKYNFNLEEAVFIGDSNHEVEVGKHFGIKTIAVTWGFSTEEKLASTNPDYLIREVKELENILIS
jgi:phosphoglycolate phosphatase-like HAD superfamily hydrolase